MAAWACYLSFGEAETRLSLAKLVNSKLMTDTVSKKSAQYLVTSTQVTSTHMHTHMQEYTQENIYIHIKINLIFKNKSKKRPKAIASLMYVKL